ncbi:MAG: adenylosuccinate lyase, partial [Candidatus Methanolliviera hydrocarbonicum]
KRGIGRQKAHEILRIMAMEVYRTREKPKDALLRDDTVKKYFKEGEIDEILDPKNYIGMSKEIVENVLDRLNERYNIKGNKI